MNFSFAKEILFRIVIKKLNLIEILGKNVVMGLGGLGFESYR
jgi:hypothetical protein